MNAPLTSQAALAANALAPRRIFNFSPGPSTMPQVVLEEAAAEMLVFRGCGVSVLEMSHRSTAFEGILAAAEADLRELLAIPAHFKVLFMQGGAIGQNAIVPLNLVARRPARKIDVVLTGEWSRKSWAEAQRYGDVALAASTMDTLLALEVRVTLGTLSRNREGSKGRVLLVLWTSSSLTTTTLPAGTSPRTGATVMLRLPPSIKL